MLFGLKIKINKSYTNKNMEEKDNLKWYQKKSTIILFLIFFFPIGLYQMWKNQIWTKTTRIVISIIFGLLLINAANKTNNSSSYSVDCECVDELNSMNYTSEKYQKCIDIAIIKNEESPLEYFKSRCNK